MLFLRTARRAIPTSKTHNIKITISLIANWYKAEVKAEFKDNYDDLVNVAEAVYCHFRSTYLQICFVRLRNAGKKVECLPVLNEEIELAKCLLAVVYRDSRIGFEASNLYYYTANDFKEKVLNCEYLKNKNVTG